jgi:trehalose/maltose hydrolase-like predicted phosphorylase
VESRFALGNGFLGARAARSISRGPTWVSWLGYIKWASWPRCYVAGVFDVPNTEPPVPALVPVADWSRVRIELNDEPQLLRDGELIEGLRTLDMRRGLLLAAQMVKQADVVALLALQPEVFPGPMAETNYRHYEPRTAHGSSLSAGMHAMVAARLGEADMALRFLHKAAAADLEFDPNSAGGIRIAGLGGVWQAAVLGFAGLDLHGDGISLAPRLPPEWRRMSFAVRWRGRSVQVRIADGTVRVVVSDGEPVGIRVAGTAHSVQGGAALDVHCETRAAVQR